MGNLLNILILLQSFLPITWTDRAVMPQALAGSGCAVMNDTIYVMGGRDSDGNRYSTNYLYVPATDSWLVRANMLTSRAHLGCTCVNGMIYAIGGWIGPTATGACEEYDPVNDTWRARAPMPTPRYTLAVAAVGGKIYVFGGMNMSGQIFSTVEEYDPVSDTWATKRPMPTARMGLGCAVIRDTVYVFGGSMTVGGGLTTVNQCYVPATDTFLTKTSMPTARYCMGGFAYSDKGYALGGYNYYSYLTVCEVYDPAANSWSTDTPMQHARQSVAAGLLANAVYVIGGWNNGSLNFNEEGILLTGIEENTGSCASSFDIFPNPFAGRTTIRLDKTAVLHNAKLQIFDIAGRFVKTLVPASSVAANGIVWNGDDALGRAVPAGVYIVQQEYSGKRIVKKAVLTR